MRPTLPCGLESALHRPFQALPRAEALLLGPKPPEAVEEQGTTGVEVDDQDLEAAIRGAVRCPRGERRVELNCVPRPLADRRRVGLA